MSHGARGSTAAHGLAPPSGSAKPQNVSHGATKLSLSAEACDDSTSKAVQAAQAALGQSIAAPPSGFTEPKAHGAPHRPLAAASTAEPSLVANSPQPLAVLPRPTPLTATTEVTEAGSPSPTWAAPPLADIWPSSSPLTAAFLQNVQQPPSAESSLGQNGHLHHQTPAVSASFVQPAMSSPPWARVAPPQHHAAQVRQHAPPVRPHPRPTAIPTTASAPVTPMPEFFIGNVPMHPNTAFKIEDDKIAAAFHKSSRKTLNFIPPSMQNGEVIVRPSIDIIRAGSQRWNTTAVGYFLGKKPYFHHLKEFVRSIWPAVCEVKATSNGFFFFQFENVAAMEEVIEGGPWLYLGQPIVLQKWEPGMVLRKLKHTEVPIWIKLRHLPVELWTTEGLSTVASGIGRPLYPDAITRACTRLDFARVCVMLNVNSKLPKHVVIMIPNELGGESACKVDVEYEWIPHKCTGCLSLGHSTKECPISKPTKPAVSIYVRKSTPTIPVAPELKLMEKVHAPQVSEEIHHQPETDRVGDERPEHGRDKAIWNVRGLNRRDHQVAVRDLANEFRLLLRWRWFVDYAGPGNRIWIAWNDEFIDVDILNADSQFVHCRVHVHELHETVLLTVVYGANELSARRELWQGLIDLAITVGNEPWLVGGDFNAVLDMSEVSGASGDIRVAMNEFNDCILQTGLLPLPMQVTRKLKALKPVFRQQRRCKGDLAMNVKLAAGFLEVAQNILQYDRHNSLLLLLEHCCRLVYLKASKLEQIMLRQRAKLQWLKGGDQCSRIFFRRVATRRANKRVFQISDDDGNEQTESNVINSIFVEFFQGLLGGDRTDRAIDLRYLRPWARHILTEDEARAIIRPVTTEEVKIAFFDIEEDKAPGPDGFSSGFFKAAWPVVGEEVSSAIIDFFKKGRLLKQLNATLLTLIPKRKSGFTHQPISKCICPGRLISDNVLLAQELFSGYNQCRLPPRCALKVDLRKAYDTVEWDFLIATLQLFGFPATFIRWIEECVTSAHYSVVVNGGVHGFLRGARGLRQGDPMSPYLFVLVMEVLHMILQQLIEQDGEFRYHWRCQDLKLFQLSFADDLILLCKADVRSVNLFSRGLDLFASLSGLHTNPQKSQLIISKAASGLRDSLLATLGFQEGLLPLRYLGLPLISARLSITDCQPLLQKIDSRIKGWEGVQISFAGRVQLIKSVLISFEVYWAMAFILPKGIIKEMIKRLRTFLWKGTSDYGYPKVAWEAVCRPIDEGALASKTFLP
ncbi:UNVERIFIED_CONTAM: Transposon TX1 uncharacterized protein [Sesamum radiatum]|uniref:Transposon TX1 uncharacterized protein n=1 Tax=Sesamum radiatum TaxID=300843 RepID=A0AAW2IP53_SESRA